jgi:hypothetical protein
MAHVAGVTILLAALALGGAARADEQCEQDRARTGVAVATTGAGLTVAAVDGASPGLEAGLQVGDPLAQVNGVVPRTCADYARAVREARRERKAILLLVRRPAGDQPLVLASRTWEHAVAAASPGAMPPAGAAAPAESPSVATLVAAARPTIPPGAGSSLGAVLQGLDLLAAPDTPPAAFRAELARQHGTVRGLAARGEVPREVVGGLETVLRYHDAAAVTWAAEDAARDRDRRPRRMPAPESMVASYFSDSPEEDVIESFPFLSETVVRPPSPGLVGESGGLWQPVRARALLRERARAEQARLATWLGMAGR